MRSFPDPHPTIPDHGSAGRYLLSLVRDLHRPMLVGSFFGIVQMLGQALVPAAIGEALEAVIARDSRQLFVWTGSVAALAVVQAGAGALRDRAALTSSLGAAYRTMQAITMHASRLGATLARKVSTGDVVTVGLVDIGDVRAAMDITTARGIGAVVAIVTVAALMLRASWQMGLLVLLGVPLMVWAMSRLIRPLQSRQGHLREQQGALMNRGADIAGGLRVLRGIGGEGKFARAYRTESQEVRKAAVDVARIEALLDGAKVILPGLLIAAVVALGAHSALAARLSVGQLIAFYGYAVFLANPLRRVTNAVETFTRAYVAAERITRVLALVPEPSTLDGRDPASAPDDVPGAAALADPASKITVRRGRLTAIVCSVPEDAITLADRFGRYTPSSTALNGVPLRQWPWNELRRRVLVVGNDARLFSGKLRDELDPLDRKDGVQAAVDAAGANDIVEALGAGLETEVSEPGRQFSGGQEQRLRLARALMFDPEVLVLVDPTNAVDATTEARVAQRLRAYRTSGATVVFTTSPVMLEQADDVFFVKEGVAVATGTHRELVANESYKAVVEREEAYAVS